MSNHRYANRVFYNSGLQDKPSGDAGYKSSGYGDSATGRFDNNRWKNQTSGGYDNRPNNQASRGYNKTRPFHETTGGSNINRWDNQAKGGFNQSWPTDNRRSGHNQDRRDLVPSSTWKAASSGASSGYSSTSGRSVRAAPRLQIEEHEREAVALIKEMQSRLVIERKMKHVRRKVQTLPSAYYECLTGAMEKRERIQHESYEEHGCRHHANVHKRIFGHSKDWEEESKWRKLTIARWLLPEVCWHKDKKRRLGYIAEFQYGADYDYWATF